MIIYLDNASTSYPKPDVVIDGMSRFMKKIGTSAGRGAYKRASKTDELLTDCRQMVCKLFNGSDPSKVIFTSNITESLNIIINGVLEEGDHVITSSLEHNSVRRPLNTLKRDLGIEISNAPCSSEGVTSPEEVEKLIKPNTKLIVFTHASNVLGTIQPIREIGAIAKKYNILFVIDSAQTAGAYPIDVVKDNIDILAFTGHKSIMGPTGTGGFLINCDKSIKPFKSGGTGGDSADPYQPDILPHKYEAGTPNVAGIIGLREALIYIQNEGIDKIRKKEESITRYALRRLSEVEGIEIYGPKKEEEIMGVISFNLKDLSPEKVAKELDRNYNIAVRVGIHCAPTAHEVMGTLDRGSVRIGIGYFNKKRHIDTLINGLKNISKSL